MGSSPGSTKYLRTLAYTALALLGGVIGLFLVTHHRPHADVWHPLIYQPGFELWRTLIIVQFGLFFPALFWSVQKIVYYWRSFDKNIYFFLSFFSIILLLGLGFIFPYIIIVTGYFSPALEFPLENQKSRMLYTLAFAATVAVANCFLLVMASGELSKIESSLKEDLQRTDISFELNQYLEIKSLVSRIIAVLSAMVTLGALATGALARMVGQLAAVSDPCGTSVPDDQRQLICSFTGDRYIMTDHVVAYGLFMTFLLATIYFPIHWRQSAAGRRIQGRLLGDQPAPASENGYDRDEWSAYLSLRGSLSQFLETDLGSREDLQSKIAILGPLLAGLGSQLFGH